MPLTFHETILIQSVYTSTWILKQPAEGMMPCRRDDLWPTLCQKSMAEIPNDVPGPLLNTGACMFRDLLTHVPHEVLTQTTRNCGVDNASADGYTRKEGRWKTDTETGRWVWEDAKRYVHVTTAWLNDPDISRLASEHPKFGEFLGAAAKIRRALLPAAEETLRELSYRHAAFRDEFFSHQELPRLVLRFLAYDWQEISSGMCPTSAVEHVDKSGITLTIWESHTGLRLTLRDGSIVEPCYQAGRSVVLVGKQAELITQGELKATLHSVKQDSHAPLSKTIARISIVGFCDPRFDARPIPDWRETHPTIPERGQ